MTKALWQSAFVAALFALHPLHVESVAWVAERKDVFSTLFWMLTMGAYYSHVERPRLQRCIPVLLFFALGLMAKPMLVTLPFVLLLLDFWPLERFKQIQSGQDVKIRSNKPVSGDTRKGKLKKRHNDEAKVVKQSYDKFSLSLIISLLWEKIPLFALAALSSFVTYIAQQKGGAVESIETYPLISRIANAFVSYITYIGKMIWPNNLAVFYLYQWKWPLWQISGTVLLFIAITLMAVWAARRFPYLSVGWFWYIGTLVPVIGIVQVGMQARADRYTYIPQIGIFIMTAWGIPELLKTWRYRKEVLIASSAVSLAFFFIVTWTQVGYWQNSFTLFDHALKVTDNNYMAYFSLGEAYAARGDQRQAIENYDKAITIKAKFAEVYYNRGNAYLALGNRIQAIQNYTKNIELKPDNAETYVNRGNAYVDLGDYQQAVKDYSKAIEVNPDLAYSYYNRGNAYAALGNHIEAVEDYNKAIEINPQFAAAYANRGGSYRSFGNQRQALEDMKTAAKLGDITAQNLLSSHGINW